MNLCIFRHDDLKQMLDQNKDSLKLDAMKRIIGVNIMSDIVQSHYAAH